VASPDLRAEARPKLPSSDVFPASAPRNTEEGRALLQARLAQFGRIGIWISSVFLALGLLTGEPPFLGGNVVEICGHHLHSIETVPWHADALDEQVSA
jgi:hypothetical protein